MKIAFLSRFQNVYERGSENFVSELSNRLSKKFKVDILSGKDADDVEKIIKRGYQLVIPINGRLQAFKVSLGRLVGKYKILITGHSGIGRDDIWNILLKPEIFVTLTEHQKQWAENWAWGSKVVKIPNGIDLKKFSPEGEKLAIDLPRPIILSAGALVWYKHHERVIDAMANLNQGSLLILGDGPLKQELIEKGTKVLGNRFKLTSYSYRDIPKVYRSVDLFTLPSWDRESFGLVYLEAMASDLGVVAPDDESRREIIGNAGIFVDVSDPIKYAKTIEQALKQDWSKKARKRAEQFSWEKIANMYEKVINNLQK